jgi:hypothetical protein
MSNTVSPVPAFDQIGLGVGMGADEGDDGELPPQAETTSTTTTSSIFLMAYLQP